METTKGPPLPCQAVEAERALTSAQPKISTDWRDWLDLPSMGWVTDGGEMTLDWTVIAWPASKR